MSPAPDAQVVQPPMKKTKQNTHSLIPLEDFVINQYLEAPSPIDPAAAGPAEPVIRKNALARWACYSRVPPRLNKARTHSQVAPPYGIQLIQSYRDSLRWRFDDTTFSEVFNPIQRFYIFHGRWFLKETWFATQVACECHHGKKPMNSVSQQTDQSNCYEFNGSSLSFLAKTAWMRVKHSRELGGFFLPRWWWFRFNHPGME